MKNNVDKPLKITLVAVISMYGKE